MKQKHTAIVLSQQEIAPAIYDMWIETPLAADARPGQFVGIYPKDKSTLLPRPISICETDAARGALRIVYRIAGAGTREFSGYREGDAISLLGNLGNGFPLEQGCGKRAFLMGGGIGVPPILELAKRLEARKDIIYACGPMPMLRAIKAYAGERDIPAYLSLEEHMACGVGACLGCVVKTKEIDHHSHVHNARICTDGPVFEAKEVEI